MGAVQDETPLRLSEQVKFTVTSELFQPAAFGAGLATAEMAGGVLSMFTVTDTVALNPAMFTAVPITTWFLPSMVTCTGGVHEAIPRRSEQVKLTVTLELFQE